MGFQLFDDVVHQRVWFSDGQTSDRVSRKSNLDQTFGALLTQAWIDTALDNAEKVLSGRSEFAQPSAASSSPAHRTPHGFHGRVLCRWIRQAVIQRHDDI